MLLWVLSLAVIGLLMAVYVMRKKALSLLAQSDGDSEKLHASGRMIDTLKAEREQLGSDIISLKSALATAREERDSFIELLDAAPIPIWRRDQNSKIIWQNRKYRDVVELEEGTEQVPELASSRDPDQARKLATKARVTGLTQSETRRYIVDGDRVSFRIVETPLEFDNELAGYALDTTAEAELAAALLDLERTRITAPFDGRISEKFVDAGQYVTPGARIARVYSTRSMEVRLPLTDRQVALIDLPLHYRAGGDSPEMPAVSLRATFGGRDWTWQGRIVRTDASVDESTRVVYAVAEVTEPFAPGPSGERPPLVPGLFVHATIEGRSLPAVVGLPRSALRSDDTVMLVDAGQQLEPRAVSVLQSEGGRVWVQGLKRGDRVVVREPAAIVAGMRVEVNEVARIAGAGN